MDQKSVDVFKGKSENITRKQEVQSGHPLIDSKNSAKPEDCKENSFRLGLSGIQGQYTDTSGELNMEASISSEDVIRAGGFGARDDISSFLPVASDSTDFEATLRDAREYEEPQGEICRPGLGWKDTKEAK